MVPRSTGRHGGALRPRIVAPGQLEPRPTGPPWLKYSESSRTPDFAHYLRPPGALVVGRGGVLIAHGTPARSTVPTPGPEATTIPLTGPRNRRTRRSDGGRGGPVFADPERLSSGPARGRRTPLGGRLRGRGGRVADKAGSGGRGGQGHTSTSTRSSTQQSVVVKHRTFRGSGRNITRILRMPRTADGAAIKADRSRAGGPNFAVRSRAGPNRPRVGKNPGSRNWPRSRRGPGATFPRA